jgi:phosphoribosylanthranilate isomerase
MKLIRTVKVGRITNLSDARYCAGMGVHMLGFNVMENQPGFVSLDVYRGVRGWFTGPSVVAEVYGLNDAQTLHEALSNYLPDFIELSPNELPFIDLPSLALIVSVSGMPADKLINLLAPFRHQVAYVQLDQDMPDTYVKELGDCYPVLLKLNGPFDTRLLSFPVKGFALEGSSEEKPGLKLYDDLAEVFEKLSED